MTIIYEEKSKYFIINLTMSLLYKNKKYQEGNLLAEDPRSKILKDLNTTVNPMGKTFDININGETFTLSNSIPTEELINFASLIESEKSALKDLNTEKEAIAEKRKNVDQLEEFVLKNQENNKVPLDVRQEVLPSRYCNTADSSCALWSTALNKEAGLMPKVIRGTSALKGSLKDWGFKRVEYDPNNPDITPDLYMIERFLPAGTVQLHQGKPYMDRVQNPDGSVTLVKGKRYQDWYKKQAAKGDRWATGHAGNVVGFDEAGNLIVRDSTGKVNQFGERTYSADQVKHGWTKKKSSSSGNLGTEGVGQKNKIVLYSLVGNIPEFQENFKKATEARLKAQSNLSLGLKLKSPELLPTNSNQPELIKTSLPSNSNSKQTGLFYDKLRSLFIK